MRGVSLEAKPRRTAWGSFKEELRSGIWAFPPRYGSEDGVELAVGFLLRPLISFYENT